MTNKEKYDNVFIESFGVNLEDLNDKFTYNCIAAWDSVGHMGMVAALEEVFGIMMETEDIIEFSSYTVGIEMLKKYNIFI